jgi:hypothetical protein
MSLAIAGLATTLALSDVPVQAQEPPRAPAPEHKEGLWKKWERAVVFGVSFGVAFQDQSSMNS